MATYSVYSDIVNATTFQAELGTYITGLSTPLSSAQLVRLNTFILSLKSGLSITNLSDFFDVLRILAGETSESSRKNLAKNAHHLSITGSPAFTQYEGWTGTVAAGNYLSSDYQPSINAVRYGLNDCAIGMYNRTAGATSIYGGYMLWGASASMINSDPTYYSRCQVNDTSYGTANISNAVGMRVTTRQSAGSFFHNVNGSELQVSRSAVNLPNIAEYIGNQSNSQVAFVFASKGCSKAQITVIINAVEAYMDANGKGVL